MHRRGFETGFISHAVLTEYEFPRVGEYPTSYDASVPGIDVFQPQYNYTPAGLVRDVNTRQWTTQSGIYLQDQMRIAEHWTVLLSGREDWAKSLTRDLLASSVSQQDDRKFTGRAGVSYSAPRGFAPYVSYSTSFVPAVGVNYYGNPYVPMTARQFEAGLKFQPAGWNSFIAASFFNINEQNVQTMDPANPLNQVQTGEVRSRGAEVEAVMSLRRGFTLHAGYSHDDSKVTSTTIDEQLGKYLPSVPRHTASKLLAYSLPRGRLVGLSGVFGVRYVGISAGSSDNSLVLAGTPFSMRRCTTISGKCDFPWMGLI